MLRSRYPSRFRPLSEGETAMASLLFGDAIDYRRVRVYNRRYMPFQPRNCAMTPNGSMYFHPSCFLPDYARGDPPERPAGVMVAAHAPDEAMQARALRALVDAGALGIETADGTWRDGQWIDFDPVAAPHAVDQQHPATGRGRP